MNRIKAYLSSIYAVLFVALAAPVAALAQAQGSGNAYDNASQLHGPEAGGGGWGSVWGWFWIALAIIAGVIIVLWLVSLITRRRTPPSPV